MTCVFNLSPDPVSLKVQGTGEITGPNNATLSATSLDLPGNGFAYIENDGTLKLSS